jgi:uncharacterized protein YjbI with pentapeptide repeats
MLQCLRFPFDLWSFESLRFNYYTQFWVYLDQIIIGEDNKVNKIFKLVYLTNDNFEITNLQEHNLEKVNLTKADIKKFSRYIQSKS